MSDSSYESVVDDYRETAEAGVGRPRLLRRDRSALRRSAGWYGTQSRLTEAPEREPTEATVEPPTPPAIPAPSERSFTPTYGFETLRAWEGTVQSVDQDSFLVVLRDLSAPAAERIVTDLPISEVSDDDRSLITEGAVFYWTIGHHSALPDGRGQRRRMSSIRFRRLPPPFVDAAEIKSRVDRLMSLFRSGDDDLAGA